VLSHCCFPWWDVEGQGRQNPFPVTGRHAARHLGCRVEVADRGTHETCPTVIRRKNADRGAPRAGSSTVRACGYPKSLACRQASDVSKARASAVISGALPGRGLSSSAAISQNRTARQAPQPNRKADLIQAAVMSTLCAATFLTRASLFMHTRRHVDSGLFSQQEWSRWHSARFPSSKEPEESARW
jgi:hypothetical protein